MAFIALSGITGCISPVTGITSAYAIKYNKDMISTYYKKQIVVDFRTIYLVVCVIANHSTQFQFLSESDRDNFYNSLP